MISLGPKSVEISDFRQAMRIMQAKLPVMEIAPKSFCASFCPVLHLSPTYPRPPEVEAAGAVSERIAPLQQHIRKPQGLPYLQLSLLSPGKSFFSLTVSNKIGQSY